MPCARDPRLGVWIHLSVYLIDFLSLTSLPQTYLLPPLYPEVSGSHCGSGPSIWHQNKGKRLLATTPILSLPPGLQPGLDPGLHCALGIGEEADTAS